jgi:hypothetical protein
MTGAELIAAERQRQVTEEGWSAEHDVTQHADGALACAASYLASQRPPARTGYPMWALEIGGKLKFNRVRELTIAGALIAAEIDRIQAGSMSTGGICTGCGLELPDTLTICPCNYGARAKGGAE